MKKLLLGLGPALLAYVLASAFVAWRHARLQNERRSAMKRLQELGEKAGRDLPAAGLAPLAEACRGKLSPGGPTSLLGYVPGMPNSRRLYGRLYGLSSGLPLSEDLATVGPLRTLGGELPGALDPRSWRSKTAAAGAGQLAPAEARYLVVTEVSEVTWPEPSEERGLEGKAVLRTRVLELPDGRRLCEGLSHPGTRAGSSAEHRGPPELEAEVAAGRKEVLGPEGAFVESLQYTPFAILCEAGGAELCEDVRAWSQAGGPPGRAKSPPPRP